MLDYDKKKAQKWNKKENKGGIRDTKIYKNKLH